jgi:hypothetical protein
VTVALASWHAPAPRPAYVCADPPGIPDHAAGEPECQPALVRSEFQPHREGRRRRFLVAPVTVWTRFGEIGVEVAAELGLEQIPFRPVMIAAAPARRFAALRAVAQKHFQPCPLGIGMREAVAVGSRLGGHELLGLLIETVIGLLLYQRPYPTTALDPSRS